MSVNVGEWIFLAIIAIMLLFAILCNSLVIFCVFRYRKLRTVTNIMICNLAVSDILLAGFVMPQRLHDITHEEYFYEGIWYFLIFLKLIFKRYLIFLYSCFRNYVTYP